LAAGMAWKFVLVAFGKYYLCGFHPAIEMSVDVMKSLRIAMIE
jgi:hypothetical protein